MKTSTSRFASLVAAAALVATACFVVSPTPNATGSPGVNLWNVATEPSPTGSWYAVDYADAEWVALGHSSDVAVSPNGATWTEYPVPSGSWQSVAYGNRRFVALSSTVAGPEELVSTNGTSWRAITGPTGSWTALTYGGGRFVAVSSTGQIDTSTNATQWRQVWNHGNLDFTSVAYGGGHFIATDSALGAVGISTNGVQWSRLFPARNTVTDWGAVTYGDGEFVVLDGSSSGYVATSVYGYVWTLHAFEPVEAVDGATFGCGSFIGVGQSGGSGENFMSSTSGTAWTTTAAPIDPTSTWAAVGYGRTRFVAVDTVGDIAWSRTTADCSATVPSPPQQVSGSVHSGRGLDLHASTIRRRWRAGQRLPSEHFQWHAHPALLGTRVLRTELRHRRTHEPSGVLPHGAVAQSLRLLGGDRPRVRHPHGVVELERDLVHVGRGAR